MIYKKLYHLYGIVWVKFGNFIWLKKIFIKKIGKVVEILKKILDFISATGFDVK